MIPLKKAVMKLFPLLLVDGLFIFFLLIAFRIKDYRIFGFVIILLFMFLITVHILEARPDIRRNVFRKIKKVFH